jgi:hypothetical protein
MLGGNDRVERREEEARIRDILLWKYEKNQMEDTG